MSMEITVLADNIGSDALEGEWGLSLHVSYGGRRFLLDTGQSELFLQNAEKLGISVPDIDCAVISHAHYDHASGIAAFASHNAGAVIYLSPNARENCYSGPIFRRRYIGLPKGALSAYAGRIERPSGVAQISDGVFLVPHSSPGLGMLGKRNRLYVRDGLRFRPDDFSHEQTLVFRTGEGLVLMNSCSHSGPEIIVKEVLDVFPGERIAAYIGGLHLFRLTDVEIAAVADRLSECGIGKIYTGHCTGQKAFGILKSRFGDRVEQFRCGMRIAL